MPKQARGEHNDAAELVRKLEQDYKTGTTTIGKYVEFSQYENVEKVLAYLYSKHVSGELDSLGREKPSFNIVIAARNIWYRATHISKTRIRIKAIKKYQRVLAFVATLLVHDWMRKAQFDKFLDKWGLSDATFGSSWLEFIERDGELVASVIPWIRAITDTVDFENNPKVKVLELTPAQLRRNKSYDQEAVEDLIDATETRKTQEGMNKDAKSDYIRLYEIHGELPLSYLTGKKKDEKEYVQQMQVVSYVASKDGEFDDFVLYKGREKNPHVKTSLIEEDGRAMGIGAIEHLFEAQWMVNHSQKQIKDYLDIASKLFFQTADPNLVGQNVLSSLENGDIIVHAANAPLNLANTAKADITSIQNFQQQWQVLGKEITSTPDAIAGNTQPYGTPFRSVAVQNKEAHSLFEVMKRNKKRYLEQIMREYVIPHVKKKMDTSDEIAALLETQDITTLDLMYVPNEAIRRDNEQVKKTILSNIDKDADDPSGIAENMDRAQLENDIRGELNEMGNQRFIRPSDIPDRTWKEALKDLEWDVEVEISDKATDDEIVANTLVDLFKVMVDPTAQQFLNTPRGKLVFNKILEKTNAISPLELSQTPDTKPEMMVPPQPAPVGGSNAGLSVTTGQTSDEET
jgi:hypothetical protein